MYSFRADAAYGTQGTPLVYSLARAPFGFRGQGPQSPTVFLACFNLLETAMQIGCSKIGQPQNGSVGKWKRRQTKIPAVQFLVDEFAPLPICKASCHCFRTSTAVSLAPKQGPKTTPPKPPRFGCQARHEEFPRAAGASGRRERPKPRHLGSRGRGDCRGHVAAA